MRKIFITGGMGYVGSALIPSLLNEGYEVVSYDLGIYGDTLPDHASLTKIIGDVRDTSLLARSLRGCTDLIHLACISNDPSFELDPQLGKQINLDAFEPMVKSARENGIQRFLYASSSSVYGVKSLENVTEDETLEPLTDYSLYKAKCEEILLKYKSDQFLVTSVRPATVCGYAPRQRLDVIVNILTAQAHFNRRMTLHGGSQKRPNINIMDMVECYLALLKAPGHLINGHSFNAGDANYTVAELAEIVRAEIVGTELEVQNVTDQRSYHISSKKIFEEIGFTPKHGIAAAVRGLVNAFNNKLLNDPMNNDLYYNIRRMQKIGFK